MNILIAGGSGFIGTALGHLLRQENHEVYILTRRTPKNDRQIQWDGRTAQGWGQRMNDMDAVVNLTGYGLEHWPWTKRQKEKFESSRVEPGRALVLPSNQLRGAQKFSSRSRASTIMDCTGKMWPTNRPRLRVVTWRN